MNWRIFKPGDPGTCAPVMRVVITNVTACCFDFPGGILPGKWFGTFGGTFDLANKHGCYWCYEAPSSDLIYRDFFSTDCDDLSPENVSNERPGKLIVTAGVRVGSGSSNLVVQLLARLDGGAFTDILGEWVLPTGGVDCSALPAEHESDDANTIANCGDTFESQEAFECDGLAIDSTYMGYGGHIVVSQAP